MSNEGYHEDLSVLSEQTKDQHRAIISLMEELEAVDWYQQRIDASESESLAAILAHNRDEELEHAAMLIEWLRRENQHFDKQLRRFLFKDETIAD